jgi:hypothetical protein
MARETFTFPDIFPAIVRQISPLATVARGMVHANNLKRDFRGRDHGSVVIDAAPGGEKREDPPIEQ